MSATPTLFVTGTDTEVGKTVCASALLQAWAAQGRVVAPFKPVASGCDQTADGLRNADALALIAASGRDWPYSVVNPIALEPAIAPHIAARRAGVSLARDVLTAAHSALAQQSKVQAMLCEGAGGWYTPLEAGDSLGEWVGDQNWPVLLVVGLRLGCLNHARLTAEAIARSGAALMGWVGSALQADWPEQAENLASLQAVLGPPVWVQRGFCPAPTVAADELWSKMAFAQNRG